MRTFGNSRLPLIGAAILFGVFGCSGDDNPTAPAPKDPTQLAFTVQPTSTTAGDAINPAIEVELRDANGNRATNARNTVTLTFAANPGSGNLSGSKTVNAVNGVASFSGVWVDKAASGYTLSASSTGLTAATSAAFNVAAGAAAKLTFKTQPPGTIEGNSAFTPEVSVTDAYGNIVSVATPVTLVLGASPGGAAVNQTVTTVNGVAAFPNLRIGQPGAGYRLSAFAEGLSGATSVAFTVRLTFISIDAGASSTGTGHSCAINATFGVYCWGSNSSGEIGTGGTTDRVRPELAVTPAGFTFSAVSTGSRTTCAIASAPTAGDVYCWGNNTQGQLGDGTSGVDRKVPTRVVTPTGVVFAQISSQGGHACGLTPAPSGVAYCWGRNNNGELGDNSSSRRLAPVAVVMPASVTFSQITAGEQHTCALAAGTSGAVYCWGNNGSGQLGDNTTTERLVPTLVAAPVGVSFVQIEAGTNHTCARTATGAAYCWGQNGGGQLGDNSTTNKLIPTAVQGGFLFSSITAGRAHSCGIQLTTNAGYCWGENQSGQLGDGTGVQKLIPSQVTGGLVFSTIRAGANHSCALVTAPAAGAYCWGANAYGEIGDGTTDQRLSPTRVVQ